MMSEGVVSWCESKDDGGCSMSFSSEQVLCGSLKIRWQKDIQTFPPSHPESYEYKKS